MGNRQLWKAPSVRQEYVQVDEELASAKERGWRELTPLDAALAAGELDEEGWHRAVASMIEDSYLAGQTPQAQSGHSGDAQRWEAGRRLVLDAVHRDGTFLDIGCANGLLMESVAEWGAEDGWALEPYGVDISPALAQLARSRLPQWSERIWTANANTWDPPRRFDFVRTGLDYVPPGRQRTYVEHLLSAVVVPGGRLIVGAFNEEADRDDLAVQVLSWGLAGVGSTRRAHRHPRLHYKAFWLDAPR